MNFRQWLRQTFAPRPQARHARPARPRCLPRVEPLEDRLSPAVLTVNSLLDNSPAGDGLVTLREAVNASQGRGRTDLGATGTGDDVIRFAPQLDGDTDEWGALGQAERVGRADREAQEALGAEGP